MQVDKPPFYLESEFTEDGSVVEWAERQGGIAKVPLATRLDIVARTAIAVAAAHSVGVLHKDIKPSNILIARAARRAPCRASPISASACSLTRRNCCSAPTSPWSALPSRPWRAPINAHRHQAVHTPPETLAGKPFTMQGDVYALGVVLYQMVVGDLDRPLAQGWERDVTDPLLHNDIAQVRGGT